MAEKTITFCILIKKLYELEIIFLKPIDFKERKWYNTEVIVREDWILVKFLFLSVIWTCKTSASSGLLCNKTKIKILSYYLDIFTVIVL